MLSVPVVPELVLVDVVLDAELAVNSVVITIVVPLAIKPPAQLFVVVTVRTLVLPDVRIVVEPNVHLTVRVLVSASVVLHAIVVVLILVIQLVRILVVLVVLVVLPEITLRQQLIHSL